MKLSVNEAKIDWFVIKKQCYYSTSFDLKIKNGAEKFPGLSGNGPLVSRIESNMPFCACVCPYAYAYAIAKTGLTVSAAEHRRKALLVLFTR